jgi:hypothetical protein
VKGNYVGINKGSHEQPTGFCGIQRDAVSVKSTMKRKVALSSDVTSKYANTKNVFHIDCLLHFVKKINIFISHASDENE